MTRKIALTSTGPLSGKSTLAKHLRDVYGFTIANHSLTLVTDFVENWNGPLPYSEQITVEQVYRDKEKWRPLLQDFGNVQGYNDDRGVEKFIHRTLSRAGVLVQARCPGAKPEVVGDVVYDPFRGEKQAEVLRALGFELVQIHIREWSRQERAARLGLDYNQIKASMDKAPELELGIEHPTTHLNGDQPVEVLGRILMHRPEGAHGYTIFGNRV